MIYYIHEVTLVDFFYSYCTNRTFIPIVICLRRSIMNYQEFLNEIETTIGKNFDAACTVAIDKIKKNNGSILDGLTIRDPSINIAPTIYLRPYYHRYLNGQPICDIYEDIMATYKSIIPKDNFDIERFICYDSIKESIVLKLINYEKNSEMLKDLPHMRLFDLAIIFQVLYSKDDKQLGTITIYQSHLDLWNVTADDVYKEAINNTPKLLPAEIVNISSIVQIPYTAYEPPMYVITNQTRTNGASCILYHNVLKDLASILHSDLILIPSSIHEFIAFPANICNDMEYYNDMVSTVNSTSVSDEEVLSDHVYMYSMSQDKIVQ